MLNFKIIACQHFCILVKILLENRLSKSYKDQTTYQLISPQ